MRSLRSGIARRFRRCQRNTGLAICVAVYLLWHAKRIARHPPEIIFPCTRRRQSASAPSGAISTDGKRHSVSLFCERPAQQHSRYGEADDKSLVPGDCRQNRQPGPISSASRVARNPRILVMLPAAVRRPAATLPAPIAVRPIAEYT